MQSQANHLAELLVNRLPSLTPDQKLVIGICGIPGSGKTTFARLLIDSINAKVGEALAILVGMDGWHYSRAELDTFPDPAEAHRRRGTAFTFNAQAFVDFLKQLRLAGRDVVVSAPSFAHEAKDPVQNGIVIKPAHRIVIIEGIYLGMNEQPWSTGIPLFDEIWLIEVDFTTALPRIIERHVHTGVTADRQSARERAETSDLPNGQYMLDRLLHVNRRIVSVEESALHQASAEGR